MIRRMLQSKIHRATVTGADFHYEGCVAIDLDLMEASEIIPNEAVAIWNVTNGSRLETYAIEGERASGIICLNGATARLVSPKGIVIIASFVDMPNLEALNHVPKLVFVDGNNRMLPSSQENTGQAKLKKVAW